MKRLLFKTLAIYGSLLLAIISHQGCGSRFVQFKPISMQRVDEAAGRGEAQTEMVLFSAGAQSHVSTALHAALNHLQHSVMSPEVPVGAALPMRESITTDPVPIPSARIREHNLRYGSQGLRLDETLRYQLTYVIQYYVEDDSSAFFRLTVRAAPCLDSAPGASPHWRDASSKPYSRSFFTNPLEARFRQELGLPVASEDGEEGMRP